MIPTTTAFVVFDDYGEEIYRNADEFDAKKWAFNYANDAHGGSCYVEQRDETEDGIVMRALKLIAYQQLWDDMGGDDEDENAALKAAGARKADERKEQLQDSEKPPEPETK